MSTVRTYEGVIQNGQIRLDPEVRLPERTQVFVVVPAAVDERPPQLHSPKLVDRSRLQEFAKEVMEVEDDAGI